MKRIVSAALAAVIAVSVSPALARSGAASDAPLTPKDESALVYDSGLGYIKGIAAGSTVADVAADFDGTLTVTDASGKNVPADGAVGTDYVLSTGAGSSPALVAGDVSRDGKVSLKDVALMLKQSAGASADLAQAAFDVNLDGSDDMKDAAQLMKYITGWDVPLGYVGWTLDLSAAEAEYEDYTLDLFFTDSTHRDEPETPDMTDVRAYVMHLAKNEAEAVNADLYSFMGHEGLNASLTPFTDKYGNTLETELLFEDFFYVRATETTVPDRLPPMHEDFSIRENTYQPLFIKVRTAPDSRAGLYRAVLTVTDADGNEIKKANVYADVWDFALTTETHAKTAMGMGAANIVVAHDYKYDVHEIYTEYYEYMLSNRLMPWCLPYDPAEDAADVWIDDPRVNTFILGAGYGGDMYTGADYGKFAKEYEKFKDNPDRLAKAMFYLVDEPLVAKQPGEGKIEEVIAADMNLQKVWPNARQIVPVPVIENYSINGEVGDTLEMCRLHTQVLCPCNRLWPGPDVHVTDVVNHYPQDSADRYGLMPERLADWKAQGKEVWWYSGNTPRSPMNNLDLENTGMEMRVLFWQQYHENVDGFLYWATNDWGATTKISGSALEGSEGLLVYCGAPYKIAGPIACYRGEIARDSLEDYEYLWLWEQKFGRDSAMEWAERIVTNTYTFERDFANLEAVRIELGDALEEAYR